MKVKKEDVLISVIIPIYNVEKHLPRCIDSILNQTYKNLEIILVNDGSPDNCGSICDKYSKQDNRIKVIHKKNSGVSAARNSGLDIAKGSFITFVDSDDYIDKNYVKVLYDLFDEQTDITICNANYIKEKDKTSEENLFDDKIQVYSNVELCDRIYEFEKGGIGGVCWGKLYRKELFNDIRFVEGMINEDEVFLHEVLYSVRQGKYTLNKLYNYCIYDDNSIMRAKYSEKRLDAIKAFEMRIDFFKDKNKMLQDKAIIKCLYVMGLHYYLAKRYIPNSKLILVNLKEKIKDKYILTKNIKTGFTVRIRLFFIRYFTNIYSYLINNLKAN